MKVVRTIKSHNLSVHDNSVVQQSVADRGRNLAGAGIGRIWPGPGLGPGFLVFIFSWPGLGRD